MKDKEIKISKKIEHQLDLISYKIYMKRNWSEQEIEILNKYYSIIGPAKLINYLNSKSISATKQKASELGLKSKFKRSSKED